MPQRYSTTITTSTGGAATVYLPATGGEALEGRILSVHYTRNTSTATQMSTGSDFTITTERHGLQVWTESNVAASKTVHPRIAVNNTVGGSTTARDYIYTTNDRLKVVVAQGGSVKTGTIEVVVG